MSDGYGMHGGSGRRPSDYDIGPDEDRLNSVRGTPVTLLSLNDNLEINYQQVYVSNPLGEMFHEPLDEGPGLLNSNDIMSTLSNSSDGRYHSEAMRLQTFQDRWMDDYPVKPTDLARNGFIHIGPRDKVKCVFCLNSLRNWEPNDSVEAEHRKHYPDCPFINGKCHHLNIPINPTENMMRSFGLTLKTSEQTASNIPDPMHDYDNRLKSFASWPKSAPIRPDALAMAGFYYTGSRDKVKCFECKNTIVNWEPGDDPWVEHAKWSPDCPYVFTVKGSAYIQHVQGRENQEVNGAMAMEISSEPVDTKNFHVLPTYKAQIIQPRKIPVNVPSAQIDEDLKSAPVMAVLNIYDVPLEKMIKKLENIRLTKGADHKITSFDFQEMTDSCDH